MSRLAEGGRATLFYTGNDGREYRIDPDGRVWCRDDAEDPPRWRAFRVVDYRAALRDLVDFGSRGTLNHLGWPGERAA